MATGDIADIVNRIKSVLPARWFPLPNGDGTSNSPVLDGVITGLAWPWAQLYALILFVQSQTSIATASGAFLDIIAQDFFGNRIARRPGQGDTSFRARILVEVLRPRVTRQSLIDALLTLTGRAPVVFQPRWPTDTGGVGFLGMTQDTHLAFANADRTGGVGGIGSLALPFQFFVTAFRPLSGGVGNVAGLGTLAPSLADLGTNGDSTIVVSTDVPPLLRGMHVLKCTVAASGSKVAGIVSATVTAGQTYGCAVWVWLPVSTPITAVQFQAETNAGAAITAISPNVSGTGSWRLAAETFAATGGITNLVLRINTPAGGGVIYATCARIDLFALSLAQPGGIGSLSNGGIGVGEGEIVSLDMNAGTVTDADIQQTIANTIPVPTIAWMRILS